MDVTSGYYYLLLIGTALAIRCVPLSWRPWILFVSSVVFYAAGGIVGIASLALLTGLNALVSKTLWNTRDSTGRNVLFWSAIVLNLSYLFGFRYLRYFSIKIAGDVSLLPEILANWLVPLGISFLTVQMMGALADAFTRSGERVRSVPEFYRFVFFFPQMTIGPIGRTSTLLPGLRASAIPDGNDLATGCALILQGMAKKFVIADRLGVYVQAVDRPEGLYYGSLVTIFASFLYFIQLYADFSGYSDIAIGSARLIGIKLPPNFNHPFAAESVTEFWRRWHISFSTWLRDYLYMPLFIHFRSFGTTAMVFSLLATFLLCGIWHGLGANFAVFGLAHGLAMSAELLTKKSRKRIFTKCPPRLYDSLGVAYTFIFCALAVVFFRSPSLSVAFDTYHRMVSFAPMQSAAELFAYKGPFMFLLTVIAALLIFVIDQPAEKLVGKKYPWAKSLGLCALILILGKGAGGDFIYAQF